MSTTLSIDNTIEPIVAPTARCADGNGTLTPLFFSDVNVDIARAKAICRRCSLAASCLEGALEREEPWGVWGGETDRERTGDRRPSTAWSAVSAPEADSGDRRGPHTSHHHERF